MVRAHLGVLPDPAPVLPVLLSGDIITRVGRKRRIAMADARQVGALLVVTGAALAIWSASSYQIHTQTSTGEVKEGLTSDPSGSHKIDASTSSGDIELAEGS
jgi:hypothetical protein